jgi:ParB-like chromosome segregation protein Spo0J
VQDIAITDLIEGNLVNPRRHLDPAKVERYARILDDLPPVVVFQLPEGLLLVDGYHRLAAAQGRGRLTVAARVLLGNREDALRYAVDLAAAEGNLPVEAVRAAIERRSADRWGRDRPPTADPR